MTDVATYDFYFASLAGESPTIDQNAPQPGFYRGRQYGELIGVAIWWDDDRLVALVGDEYQDPTEVWMNVASRPVKEDYYRAWSETGKWPDDLPEEAKPKPASNAPTPLEELTDEIESAVKAAFNLDFGETISDDASRDGAQALRARLNELSGKADKIRETEKRPHLDAGKPHLDAGKEVDERWKPLVKKAKGAADRLRASLSAYETAQRNKRLAEERARNKRLSPTEEDAFLVAGGKPSELPGYTPQPETQIKGAYGRAAGKHLKRVAVITGIETVLAYFKEDDRLIELIQKLAQEAVDAGTVPPGVMVDEEVDVR